MPRRTSVLHTQVRLPSACSLPTKKGLYRFPAAVLPQTFEGFFLAVRYHGEITVGFFLFSNRYFVKEGGCSAAVVADSKKRFTLFWVLLASSSTNLPSSRNTFSSNRFLLNTVSCPTRRTGLKNRWR